MRSACQHASTCRGAAEILRLLVDQVDASYDESLHDWADKLDGTAQAINMDGQPALWEDDGLTQREQNASLLHMLTLFETASSDLLTAADALHFPGTDKLRDKWRATAKEMEEVAQISFTGLDAEGKSQALAALRKIKDARGAFGASVLLKRDLLTSNLEKGIIPHRMGEVLALSSRSAFPGMVLPSGILSLEWRFCTGDTPDSGHNFGPDNVSILRLRDNHATRAHFAGAPLARAPFAFKWVAPGVSLF